MMTWKWLALGLVAAWFLLRKKAVVVPTTLPAAYGPQVQSIVLSQGAGGAWYDTNPDNYHLVTDALTDIDGISHPMYPGWYRSNVDGSWFNPETGEFYSANSSPVAVGLNGYESGKVKRVTIDPTVTYLGSNSPPPDPTSANNPANGYVIY
jgi:hypothetical protein